MIQVLSLFDQMDMQIIKDDANRVGLKVFACFARAIYLDQQSVSPSLMAKAAEMQ